MMTPYTHDLEDAKVSIPETKVDVALK